MIEDLEFEEDDIVFSEEETTELYERYRFVADKGQGALRVDKYLSNMLGSGISRTRIQDAADAGYIKVNNEAIKASYKVKPFDTITISL